MTEGSDPIALVAQATDATALLDRAAAHYDADARAQLRIVFLECNGEQEPGKDHQQRCGQIQIVLKPQWLEGFENGGTTHGLWNPYDSHIPLIWYGWKIQPGSIYRETYMTDIAATLAALLKIQAPSGNIGQVITELIR